MSTLNSQEQEQIEALKSWWKENGKWLMLTAALVLGGFSAITGWNVYQKNHAIEAGTLYVELERQLFSNDPKRINDAATVVIDKFGSSAYAPRAALIAANVNIQVGDRERAKTQLQWVIDHADDSGLHDVARLKLASVLLDEKKYAEALILLGAKSSESFSALYSDLKGDVLSAQGKSDEARTAYQLAISKMDSKSEYRGLIQIKLDALAGEE